MRYYPICLDVRHRKCLVVGGGAVGTRKALSLVGCGARVTVVSPEASPQLQDLAANGALDLVERPFRPSDLAEMFLVIGATDDEALNQRIYQEAEQRRLLCNIADRPAACNFILPSILNRGDLVIAISTSGQSPALAKKLRQDLETVFGDEYAQLLQLMGAIRQQLLGGLNAPEDPKALFEKLIAGRLIDLIKQQNKEAINRLLLETLGEGYDFDRLMSARPEIEKV